MLAKAVKIVIASAVMLAFLAALIAGTAYYLNYRYPPAAATDLNSMLVNATKPVDGAIVSSYLEGCHPLVETSGSTGVDCHSDLYYAGYRVQVLSPNASAEETASLIKKSLPHEEGVLSVGSSDSLRKDTDLHYIEFNAPVTLSDGSKGTFNCSYGDYSYLTPQQLEDYTASGETVDESVYCGVRISK